MVRTKMAGTGNDDLKAPVDEHVEVKDGADFLLVEGNPDEHISGIRHGRLAMKDDTLYNSADLCAAAGIQPAE